MADPGVNKTITRYYSLAGQRAVRKDAGGANEELYYLLTDHLGSVSAVVDASGGLVSEQRYLPFGGVRDEDYITDPINETDFGYTGQRNNAEIGWIDYRSRFLSTQIARFTQPDTIVPNLYDPQSLNKYSYVINNPLRYIDPSGHYYECPSGRQRGGGCNPETNSSDTLVTFTTSSGNMTIDEIKEIRKGARKAAEKIAEAMNAAMGNYIRNLDITPITSTEAWNFVFGGPVNWDFVDYQCEEGCWAMTLGKNSVRVYSDAVVSTKLALHELGHAFDQSISLAGRNTLNSTGIQVGNTRVAGYYDDYVEPGTGVMSEDGEWIPPNHYLRTDLGYGYQYNTSSTPGEDFADTFMNWALGSFASDNFGQARADFMNLYVAEWIF